MLNEFRGIDIGHHPSRLLIFFASRVGRTVEAAIQQRPIDFLEPSCALFRFDSDHDAFRMKEVFDCRPLAEEFRVGSQFAAQSLIGIQLKLPLQLLPGLYRHGAFLDDQAIAGRVLYDRAGNIRDGRKVRLSVLRRRRAHTDKNDLSAGHRVFSGIESQPARKGISGDDLFQVGSKKGIWPLRRRASFDSSLSAQLTLWPISARQAAVVKPT